MFSHRTDWDLSENPLSLTLKQLKAKGVSIIDLTESNPTQINIPYPDDLLSFFTNPQNLSYEPISLGKLKTREAIATYYQKKNITVPSERILLTSSTSEGYSFLFKLLCNPYDAILIPTPGYPLFSYLAQLNDVHPIEYHLTFQNDLWQFNIQEIETLIKNNPIKAIVLVSPNNPTGSFMSQKDFDTLNHICQKYQIAIISDEVFSDYVFSPYANTFESALNQNQTLTFTLSGISKILALPQMKLSWIAVNGPEPQLTQALSRLEVIADTYLSVSTPIQNAAIQWLEKSEEISGKILARVEHNLMILKQAIANQNDIEFFQVQAGWYAILKIPITIPEDEWVIGLLKEKTVYVHPGFYFDFPEEGIIVLSLLPPTSTFQQGLQSLIEYHRVAS